MTDVFARVAFSKKEFDLVLRVLYRYRCRVQVDARMEPDLEKKAKLREHNDDVYLVDKKIWNERKC